MASHFEVAKRWAERSGPCGRAKRDLSGHHVFMEGDTIYSYGRHFTIARWETLPSGERVALFNSDGYSVSTAKQQGIVRGAFRRFGGMCQAFTVPFGYFTPENLKWYDARIAECEAKAKRARVYSQSHLEQADRYREERARYVTVLDYLHVLRVA